MSLRPTPARLRGGGRRNGGRGAGAPAAAALGAFAGCAASSARTGFAAAFARAGLLAGVVVNFFLLIRCLIYPSGGPSYRPWHFLNFLPLPHQHGSFRPSFPAGTGAALPSPPLGLPAVATTVAAPACRPLAVASAAGGVGVGGSLTSCTRKTVVAMSNWIPFSSSWDALDACFFYAPSVSFRPRAPLSAFTTDRFEIPARGGYAHRRSPQVFAPLAVYGLALFVHDVAVIAQVTAVGEVGAHRFGLGALDLTRNEP